LPAESFFIAARSPWTRHLF